MNSSPFSAKRLTDLSRIAAACLLIASIWATVKLMDISFDYNLENYFPKQDEAYALYDEYVKELEDDFNIILIGIRPGISIMDSVFISQVNQLDNELKSLDQVNEVINPFQYKKVIISPLGPIMVPVFKSAKNEAKQADSSAIMQTELIGNLISTDFQAINIIVRHQQKMDKLLEDQLSGQIQELVNSYEFEESHISGRIVGQSYYSGLMQEQFSLFTLIGFLILVSVLIYFYRSAAGVLIPLVIVLISNLLLISIALSLKGALSIMMTIVPTIIFIVGVSDIIHLFSTYTHQLEKGGGSQKVLRITLIKVGLPTLLTSLTTAFGFVTLISAEIPPIVDFGVITAIGIVLALFVTYLIFVFFHLNIPRVIAIRSRTAIDWRALMGKIFIFTFRKQKFVWLISTLVFVIGLTGLLMLKTDNYIMEDLSHDDEHRLSFEFIETYFNGVKPFEIAIRSKDKKGIDIFNRDHLNELVRVESFLNDSLKLFPLISPVIVMKMMNRSINGGMQDYFTLPDTDRSFTRISKYRKMVDRQLVKQKIVSQDRNLSRITGRTRDIGGRAMREKYAAFEQFVASSDFKYIEPAFTGLGYLIDKTNHQLVRNLLLGLALAITVVAIIIGFMFLSFRIVLASIVVNLMPLIFIGGMMGYMGIHLNLSTAIIFSIAFGIAVDDSIHFLGKYRIERAENKSVLYAIKSTYMSSGKAIIITSIVILAGFVSLFFAKFNSIYYMGLLVTATLFIAVLADLFLLPLLIWLAEKKRGMAEQVVDVP